MSLPSPPSRKPPYKHIVHHHVRKTPKTKRTIKIDDYRRGKGLRKATPTRKGLPYQPQSGQQMGIPRYLGGSAGSKHTYNFRTDSESVQLHATDMTNAVNLGLSMVRRTPKIIRLWRLD